MEQRLLRRLLNEAHVDALAIVFRARVTMDARNRLALGTCKHNEDF
jgi:hypothetical protein